MNDLTALSHRDRAVLRAVAAGRCCTSGGAGAPLVIDGLGCCDQLVGPRLAKAGLISLTRGHPGPVQLTPYGRTLLATGPTAA